MGKVILVQPFIGDWDQVRSHPSVPLSLLSATRIVADYFETLLIDTRIEKNWKEILKEELKQNPICVGITSMTGHQIKYASEIASFVKSNSPIPVIWGGIHASILPQPTIENDNVDIIVKGEGEKTFFEVVNGLYHQFSLKGIEGIWYKQGSKIVKNPDRPFLDLDSLPDLPLDLINLKNYLPIFKGRRTLYIETSRGCPCQCTFCYNKSYNKNKFRAFSAERVIKDISLYVNQYNIDSFYVVDDNSFVNIKRIKKVLESLVSQKLNAYFEFQGISINSALKMDDEYFVLMVEAGVKKLHFGVESASQKILDSVNKKLTIENVHRLNQIISKYPIVVQYNFMCGFPNETLDDIIQTKDAIFKLMKENPYTLISPICPYTPYPGTASYKQTLTDGFIEKTTLEDWSNTDYGDDLWISKEKSKLLSALFFVSLFLDKHRSSDMFESILLKFLISLYRPIAKLRLKYLFFKFMPELAIKNMVDEIMKIKR